MKTKKINEVDLRNIINKKVYESLNFQMYYVIDEATEEIIENNSDLQEAIEDAKQLALKGGCYLVIDKNDKIYYKTSEESYKFEECKSPLKEELDVHGISSQIKDWAYGVIDYLYQEGVMEYADERRLMAMGNGELPINYNEIIKLILSNNTTNCDCEAGQVLRNYLKVKKSGDAGTFSYVEDAIKQAFKEFADNSGIGFYNTVMGLKESDIKRIVRECVKRSLNEYGSELDYDLSQLNKAMQISRGTYHAKSNDGSFETGDKVIMHTKNGDIEGIIEDFDMNDMTWKETADIKYFDKERGHEMTMVGYPIEKLEKVENVDKIQEAVAKSLRSVLKEMAMSPEEQEFRANLPRMIQQDEVEYIGKMPNGNTMIKYLDTPFEVTPQGKMLPVKNDEQLHEIGDTRKGSFKLGAVAGRAAKRVNTAKTPEERLKYAKITRDALNTFDDASNKNGERDSKLSRAFKKGLTKGEKLDEESGMFDMPIEDIRLGDEISKIYQAASNISRLLGSYQDDNPSDYDKRLEEWSERLEVESEEFLHHYKPEAFSK